MAEAERWAAGIKGPAYAIDAQTAIKVTDGSIEVVSEGHWKLLNPAGQRVVPGADLGARGGWNGCRCS